MHSPLLPYAQIPDFLAKDGLDSLLRWVLDNESIFTPATVFDPGVVVDPAMRTSLTCYDFEPMETQLRQRFAKSLPTLMARIGAVGPQPSKIELQLAAYGDGAFYRPHTDIPIGDVRKERKPEKDRVISAVLYFHAEPKAFSGGELRLFRLGAEPANDSSDSFVELEPLHNSLVIFHSWMTHEVRPVRCPSRKFADSRFSVNCWFRRNLAISPG